MNQSQLDLHPHSKICWAAIFAGAFTALGLAFLLHLFALAIGLSAYAASPDGASTIAIGGFLGFVIGIIVSMAVAGFVAGYLMRCHYNQYHEGVIYGFLTWSLALLLSAVFVMPLSHYTGAYTKALAPTVTINESSNSIDVSTNKVIAPDTQAEKNQDAATVEVTAATLTGSSWMMFVLFFLGAFASCIGACCGIKSHCNRPHVE